ncbi:ABC transporter permease [Pararhizobium haloflavum]|uniref:ABC transporter permease n=1 Tax=Pararhizobium haloflavum TaxID=2037914 RepID=UPI000C1A52C2|nr:ABC transporter permease [Pararhizobium haloflavum]
MTITTARLLRAVTLVVLLIFLFRPETFEPMLALLVANNAPAIYNQGSLLSLTISHLAIAIAATAAAALISVGFAILVTRDFGREFLPLSRSVANIGQTFPPVAVLALAVPIVGFGTKPTLIALFLYALLPIFENALTGLTGLAPTVREAARGVGMTGFQRLLRVELPLAFPVILTGIRLAFVISLGTATIGSTVAAPTLGEVIIAGLLSSNTAFVLQGGIIVAALAVLSYDGLTALERLTARRTGRVATAV